MNRNRARMIVFNPDAGYTAKELNDAAVYLLGTLGITEEEHNEAVWLLARLGMQTVNTKR